MTPTQIERAAIKIVGMMVERHGFPQSTSDEYWVRKIIAAELSSQPSAPDGGHMLFSQRRKFAESAEQWCRDNAVSANPFNIVTALEVLGAIAKPSAEPQPAAAGAAQAIRHDPGCESLSPLLSDPRQNRRCTCGIAERLKATPKPAAEAGRDDDRGDTLQEIADLLGKSEASGTDLFITVDGLLAERDTLRADVAALRAEVERLTKELSSARLEANCMRAHRDENIDNWAEMKAERDTARRELEGVRGELDRVRAVARKFGHEGEKVTAELDALRGALRTARDYLVSDLNSPCSITDHIMLGNDKLAHEAIGDCVESIDAALSAAPARGDGTTTGLLKDLRKFVTACHRGEPHHIDDIDAMEDRIVAALAAAGVEVES